MDIATLYGANFPDLGGSQAAYDRLVADFGHQIDTWNTNVVNRLLHSHWTGSTADQVHSDVQSFTSKLQAAHDELALVSGILRDAGEVFATAQSHLVSALDDAKAAGLTVGPDARITWDNNPNSPKFAGHGAPATAQAISARITAALNEADQADQEIARRLRHFVDNARSGTGLDSATAKADTAAVSSGSIPDAKASPDQVKAWWNGLTLADQQRLIREHPDQIGNRDGIPTIARDQANRITLTQTRTEMQSELDGIGPEPQAMNGSVGAGWAETSEHRDWRQKRDDLTDKLRGIDAIQSRLDHSKAPTFPPTYLMGFDTKGHGHAIVAVNNPDTADNVLTFVPGTTARLGGMGGDTDKAYEMAEAARQASMGTKTTSAIAWTGYDAPQQLGPADANPFYALDARDKLHSFETGLRTTHEGQPSHNTILGHSYGSTVVGYAMADKGGLPVDNAIFIGSPGVGVQNARDLNIDPARVYAGRGSGDWAIGMAGDTIYGPDPTDPSFGAQYLPAGSTDHSHCWAPNSTSWQSIGEVAAGMCPSGQ